MALNGTFILLIPVACMILKGVSGQAAYQDVFLDFLFYSLFTPICMTMMNRIMFASEELMAAKSAVKRIEEVLKEESLPENGRHEQPKDASISFENVSFSYPGTEEKSLDQFSFELPAGKTVALVGASGSGKSTAAKLIPRFYDASEGSVLVGGVNVKNISKEALMSEIAFVFQNTKLFKDTILGNGGTYLSGGENQRIALARAILKDAPIIVLDVATASLDVDNETEIQEAISCLVKGKTVLVIAHRMHTVENADQIIVLDGGVVREKGTHAELMAQGGLYRRFIEIREQAEGWRIG